MASALGGAPLALLLITHGHPDHVKGVPAIVGRWPEVRVRRFGEGDAPLVDDEQVAAGDGFVDRPAHAGTCRGPLLLSARARDFLR